MRKRKRKRKRENKREREREREKEREWGSGLGYDFSNFPTYPGQKEVIIARQVFNVSFLNTPRTFGRTVYARCPFVSATHKHALLL